MVVYNPRAGKSFLAEYLRLSLEAKDPRTKELEDKLKIAVSALKRVDNIAYEYDLVEINNLACDALEKIGELK